VEWLGICPTFLLCVNQIVYCVLSYCAMRMRRSLKYTVIAVTILTDCHLGPHAALLKISAVWVGALHSQPPTLRLLNKQTSSSVVHYTNTCIRAPTNQTTFVLRPRTARFKTVTVDRHPTVQWRWRYWLHKETSRQHAVRQTGTSCHPRCAATHARTPTDNEPRVFIHRTMIVCLSHTTFDVGHSP